MKKTIFTSIVVFLAAYSVYGQQGEYGQHQGNGQGHQQQGNWQEQSPDDRAKTLVSKLGEKMQITAPQKDSLQIIFKKFFDNVELYKAQASPDIFDALKTKRDNAVKRVLADSTQYAAYQNFLTSMKHAQQNQDNQQNWHHQEDNGNGGDNQDYPDQNNPH